MKGIAYSIHSEWLYNLGSMALGGAILFANKENWYNAMQEKKAFIPEEKSAEDCPEGEECPEKAEGEEGEEAAAEDAALHAIFNL